jgi:hypothetical protein
MNKGILVYARNNKSIDYVKQAHFFAQRAKKLLGLPTTIVTDSIEYIKKEKYIDAFDKVVPIVWKSEDHIPGKNVLSLSENHHSRKYHDGTVSAKSLPFKNGMRCTAYDASPYDETILIDTDVMLMNDVYKHCFEQSHDFLIYDKSFDLAGFRDPSEFAYISDTSVKFYWATVVFFRKTKLNKIFFDLVSHIYENWYHYRSIFQIPTVVYRNDFAFSIAIHIINGYQLGEFSKPMPGKLFFTTDRDILWKLNDNQITFLLEKEKYFGQYTLASWQDHNIHIMNKFSLERAINNV